MRMVWVISAGPLDELPSSTSTPARTSGPDAIRALAHFRDRGRHPNGAPTRTGQRLEASEDVVFGDTPDIPFIAVRHAQRRAIRGKSAAPRGALLYPQFSWEELGGRFLGLMADLDPKGEGDQSMPGKRWPCPGVRARGAAGPAEYGESWIARSPISRRCKPPSTCVTNVEGSLM